jgi:Resolvase, N terminal domain
MSAKEVGIELINQTCRIFCVEWERATDSATAERARTGPSIGTVMQLGAYVREGDILVVTKLDRLARSVSHLVAIGERLEAKGVALRVLEQAIDTSTSTGRLMFNMLGAIAQFERELMLERQRKGIAG